MLDPWIIEEIRRREEEERQHRERPVLEVPLDVPAYPVPGQGGKPAEEEGERGVVIVDFSVF
jgi:hypothetical protein